MEDIRALCVLLSETFQYPLAQISGDTRLIDSGLNLDSLRIVRLITVVERRFDIKLGGDILAEDHFVDVNSLWRLVEKARRRPCVEER